MLRVLSGAHTLLMSGRLSRYSRREATVAIWINRYLSNVCSPGLQGELSKITLVHYTCNPCGSRLVHWSEATCEITCAECKRGLTLGRVAGKS